MFLFGAGNLKIRPFKFSISAKIFLTPSVNNAFNNA